MLRQFSNFVWLKPQILQLVRQQSTATANKSVNKVKWDLLVGIQIERLPIISKTLSKLEQQYQDMLWQIEYENSYKSDFEVQHEKDVRMAELIKAGKVTVDLDAVAKQTSEDMEDLWKEERDKFQTASRTTQADQKNDLQSTERKLERSLTLILEQKIGNDQLFLLPQGKLNDGETLAQAAQRIVTDLCGKSIQTQLLGNAPCGFYKYKYPSASRNESVGAKVFFYRAVLKGGEVDKKTASKFEWLDRDELLLKVDKFAAYKKSLSQFII